MPKRLLGTSPLQLLYSQVKCSKLGRTALWLRCRVPTSWSERLRDNPPGRTTKAVAGSCRPGKVVRNLTATELQIAELRSGDRLFPTGASKYECLTFGESICRSPRANPIRLRPIHPRCPYSREILGRSRPRSYQRSAHRTPSSLVPTQHLFLQTSGGLLRTGRTSCYR